VSTQALCLAWAFDEEEEVHLWHRAHPWTEQSERPDELIERIRDGEEVEAHNAGFEFYIWNIALRNEFPEFDVDITLDQLRCSAAKASCMSLPRSLGDAVQAVQLEHRKTADGRRLIQKLSKPMPKRKGVVGVRFCEEQIEHERNWDYCKQDVRSERGLSNYCPPMTPRELDYWRMDFRMNQRGILLDLPGAERALELAAVEAGRLNVELNGLTEGFVDKFSRRKPLLKWLNGKLMEIGAEPLENTKADTFSFALYGVPTKAGDEAKAAIKPTIDAKWEELGEEGARVKRVVEISMEGNRSSVAKYRRMKESVCGSDNPQIIGGDDRLHDIMLYNGADRTGRWAGKGVQPHNFVRGYSKDMCEVWEDLLGELPADCYSLVWGDELTVVLAKACRGALIASPGKELYAADFNAIEARKLAWLSGCARLLTLFNTPGGDPYLDMATAIYGREITKKDKTERNLGKKAILGLGYAMGWEKFQMTVWMDEGIWLSDEFCQKIVKTYRQEMYPEVPMLWKATERASIAAVVEGGEHYCGGDEFGVGAVSYFIDRDFLHCRLPSGRLLSYLYPEVHTRINYRFAALNERGSPSQITFPAKKNVALNRVRHHAEKLAAKQKKTLLDGKPESFLQPHLSFMGRDTYTKQWKRLGTHGGTLVENYDQASSRDLLAESMFRVDETPGFALLLSIHDEVIAEAPKGTCTREEFEAVMAEGPKWAPGMPIAAEGWIGERLRK
jgi:DNA polymerase